MEGLQITGQGSVPASPVQAGVQAQVQQVAGAPKSEKKAQGIDSVQLSRDAKAAAAAARLFEETEQEAVERTKRVDKIRQHIQDGSYKLQQAVLMVAARIAKYVSN